MQAASIECVKDSSLYQHVAASAIARSACPLYYLKHHNQMFQWSVRSCNQWFSNRVFIWYSGPSSFCTFFRIGFWLFLQWVGRNICKTWKWKLYKHLYKLATGFHNLGQWNETLAWGSQDSKLLVRFMLTPEHTANTHKRRTSNKIQLMIANIGHTQNKKHIAAGKVHGT